MTPNEKIARKLGWTEVRLVARHLIRRPRASVGIASVLVTIVLVAIATVPILDVGPGGIGIDDIGAAVSAGLAAGVVTAFVCVLVWRHRDYPRRNKPASSESWLAERYLASIGETRERASSSGDDPQEAVNAVVRATLAGERSRVLPVLRDLIPRQVAWIVLMGVGESIGVPLLLLGLFGHVGIWSLLTILLVPGPGLFLLPKLVEGVGFSVQIRDWLVEDAGATR